LSEGGSKGGKGRREVKQREVMEKKKGRRNLDSSPSLKTGGGKGKRKEGGKRAESARKGGERC